MFEGYIIFIVKELLITIDCGLATLISLYIGLSVTIVTDKLVLSYAYVIDMKN